MRGWAVVAACLAVVCGLTVWAWWGEREAHQVTRVELAKAQARLSALAPPDPAAPARAIPERSEVGVHQRHDLAAGTPSRALRRRTAGHRARRGELRLVLPALAVELGHRLLEAIPVAVALRRTESAGRN
jgi:hypothetical protein